MGHSGGGLPVVAKARSASLKSLNAGSARRNEESQLAEDFLAQLMAELGGDGPDEA